MPNLQSKGKFYLRQGYDYQKRAIEFLDLNQVCKQGNCLNGFSKTHLISEDTIQGVVV